MNIKHSQSSDQISTISPFFLLFGLLMCTSGCHLISPLDSSNQTLIDEESRSSCLLTSQGEMMWWEGEWIIDADLLTTQGLTTYQSPKRHTGRLVNQESSDIKPQEPQIEMRESLNKRSKKKNIGSFIKDPKTPTGKVDGSVSQAEKVFVRELSLSLAASWQLKISPQQATLTIDQDRRRLAISPLSHQQGVNLIGGRMNSMLWCEGTRVFWSEGTSRSLELKRIHLGERPLHSSQQ